MDERGWAQTTGDPKTYRSDPNGHLVSLLAQYADFTGETGLRHVSATGDATFQSYAELYADAKAICAGLQQAGMRPGQYLLFQLAGSKDVITVFWGCILAGVVPIPLNPPPTYSTYNSHVKKWMDVWTAFGQPVCVVSEAQVSLLVACAKFDSNFKPRLLTCEALRRERRHAKPHDPSPDDVAVLFLTSGSTGVPKGVPQTHANILAMVDGTIQMNGFTEADVTLNWMSLDHAGSLIFLGAMAVALSCTQVHVPIDYIMQRPLRWLDAIDDYRASISWAPNFVFSLFLDREQDILAADWDLSCMRFMVNAGEAVVAKTARAFVRLLGHHGLANGALRPAFGMVETCSGITWSDGFTLKDSTDDDSFVSLGRCIPGAAMRVVDHNGKVRKEGEEGRLQLMGPSVFSGYEGQPALNEELFEDEWMTTGDLAFLRDGGLFITGREKDVIIINGNNFYCHDIESAVEQVEGVERGCVAACGVRDKKAATEQLALYFLADERDESEWNALYKQLRVTVMNAVGISPAWFIRLERDEFPRTEIGKIQRRVLVDRYQHGMYTERARSGRSKSRPGPRRLAGSGLIEAIAELWCEVLQVDELSYDETFFEVGGDSLRAIQVQQALEPLVGRPVSMVELFSTPTIRSMARYFGGSHEADASTTHASLPARKKPRVAGEIAVVGVACRFPGAQGPLGFWDNLVHGVESITFYGEAEAIRAGMSPANAARQEHVHAAPILEDLEGFDADFWRLSEQEAELIDPQHRVFLETAWEAFEDAGYRVTEEALDVGVFASAGTNTYLLNHIFANAAWVREKNQGRLLTVDSMNGFDVMIANDKDYLPTRVSYKLNLRGPCMNVQSACSSTLLAVHEACKSLRAGECSMALAGGCGLMIPQHAGHLYEEGMIITPDGHCRAYDADAQGTIFGSGSGAVLLKPLETAQAEGDHIYAVILGSSVCNDGGDKMGYTAPSMQGEYDAVRSALADANVQANSIAFVEGHGTGTPVGDPIEVEALTKAFREHTDQNEFCALGSVKTNIGHMGIASGIAGFIKTVLALKHEVIPPTLHYRSPNPAIDFDTSPFYVNTETVDWPRKDQPRRASVNSLGIGGTNVHVVLEEAPTQAPRSRTDEGIYLLPISARTPEALKARVTSYEHWLVDHPDVDLGDLCYTAQVGRKHFACRVGLVAEDREGLIQTLRAFDVSQCPRKQCQEPVFLYTGQGGQFVDMGRGLYDSQPVFREALDACAALFEPHLAMPLLDILFSKDTEAIHETQFTQPVVFSLQVALTTLLNQYGVRPACMIGHSIGEFAAAWHAGIFRLEDAVKLVVARAGLMQALPMDGSMVAIHGSCEEVAAAGENGVAIAAVNAPKNTVISGLTKNVRAVCARLEEQGVSSTPLRVSHAFHSASIDPMLGAFGDISDQIVFSSPSCPMIATAGTAAQTDEMACAAYWRRQVRDRVDFMSAVRQVLSDGATCFVEVGPGTALCGFGRAISEDRNTTWLPSIRYKKSDPVCFARLLGGLYEQGVDIDWEAVPNVGARKVSLPTYPWQRQRCWIAADGSPEPQSVPPSAPRALGSLRELPYSEQRVYDIELLPETQRWLPDHEVFGSVVPPGAMFAAQLLTAAADTFGVDTVSVRGLTFRKPLVIDGCDWPTIQIVLSNQGGEVQGEIISFLKTGAPFAKPSTLHASGQVAVANDRSHTLLSELQERCTDSFDSAEIAETMQQMGVGLGPTFHWMVRGWRGEKAALVEFAPPEALELDEQTSYHPGLIDSHWQVLLAAMPPPDGVSFIPFEIDEITAFQWPTGGPLWAYAEWESTPLDQPRRRGHMKLFNEAGVLLLETQGLELRPVSPTAIRQTSASTSSEHFYRVGWALLPRLKAPPLFGTYVIAGDECRVQGLARTLAVFGAKDIRTCPSCDTDALFDDVSQMCRDNTDLTLVYCAPVMEEAQVACLQLLAVAQGALHSDQLPSRFILVTCGAVAQSPAELVATSSAMVWAQACALAEEWVDVDLVCVDVEDLDSSEAALAEVIARDWDAEPRVCIRSGQLFGQRLEAISDLDQTPWLFDRDAVQLVTGGWGGLGLEVAAWMVECGARTLVLAGRRPPDATVTQRLDAWRSDGVVIHVQTCDVSSSKDMAGLFEAAAELGPLQLVIHAAGVRNDGTVGTLTPTDFEHTFAPKLLGGAHLVEQVRRHRPKQVILFSSVASLLGSAGQTNYAAANGALDAMAAQLAVDGISAVSVHWGPWSGVGMTVTLDSRSRARFVQQGYHQISPAMGLQALGTLCASPSDPCVAFMPVDRERMARRKTWMSLWKDLVTDVAEPSSEEPRSPLTQAVKAVAPEARRNVIEEYLLQSVSALIDRTHAQELDVNKGFVDLGIDSLDSIKFKTQLERDCGLKLRSTVVFDYPTIHDLSEHIEELVVPGKDRGNEMPVANVVPDNTVLDALSSDALVELLENELR